MIRNVSIHVTNEQPLLCDLFDLPSPNDLGLLCTNVRGTDGKRPVFIDSIRATFFFPYHVIRFLEIPEGALAHHQPGEGRPNTMGPGTAGYDTGEADPGSLVPIAVGGPDDAVEDDFEVELEIDEGFLQRIRDI